VIEYFRLNIEYLRNQWNDEYRLTNAELRNAIIFKAIRIKMTERNGIHNHSIYKIANDFMEVNNE